MWVNENIKLVSEGFHWREIFTKQMYLFKVLKNCISQFEVVNFREKMTRNIFLSMPSRR